MLFLIIFVWTPPHFWSLALYRAKDYATAGLPMLPVTHGPAYTRLMIVLYTAALFAATLLPYAVRMSGGLYLAAAVVLGGDVPRPCAQALPALQRRAGATHVPFLHRLSRLAVFRVAPRPLLALMRLLLAPVAVLLALGIAACGPAAPKFRGSDITGVGYGHDFRLNRPRRQVANAGGLPRQGRGALLWLHAVPGRLPDDALRARHRRRPAGRRRRRACRCCS